MFGILALLCIVLGFVVGITDADIVFAPTVWFIAAIAFALLGPIEIPANVRRRRGDE